MMMNYAPDKGQDEVKLQNVVRVHSLLPSTNDILNIQKNY